MLNGAEYFIITADSWCVVRSPKARAVACRRAFAAWKEGRPGYILILLFINRAILDMQTVGNKCHSRTRAHHASPPRMFSTITPAVQVHRPAAVFTSSTLSHNSIDFISMFLFFFFRMQKSYHATFFDSGVRFVLIIYRRIDKCWLIDCAASAPSAPNSRCCMHSDNPPPHAWLLLFLFFIFVRFVYALAVSLPPPFARIKKNKNSYLRQAVNIILQTP